MTATLNTVAVESLCWLKELQPRRKRLFFPLIMFFFPKAISEDKYRGKGRSIV